jgi:hypothetical protein
VLPPPEDLPTGLVKLLSAWEKLPRGLSDLPRLADFDPMSVPHLLPNVYLIAVEGRERPRFRFRLLGESVLAAGGPGRPGLYVDQIPRTSTGVYLHDHLSEVVHSRKPNWYRGPPTLKHDKFVIELEGIMLPMANDNDDVEALLCMTVYRWSDGRVS